MGRNVGGCGEECWGCGGRCRKVSDEVWESVLGRSVGGVGKCVGGGVVWGLGVWGEVWRR